jgi:hypothetical protein
MKKTLALFLALAMIMTLSSQVLAKGGKKASCTNIQDGTLTYSTGHYLETMALMTGFDPYGYNYQAHMFKGSYANAYLGKDKFPPYLGDDETYLAENPQAEAKWYWPYRTTILTMKWNDAWLSNKDCDEDGLLDRYYDFDSYIGSGAWLTNHMWDSYEMNGEQCKSVYFTKIVAVPEDAKKRDDNWYDADGTEIGPVIWGSFATIQSIYNDPCGGAHGVEYLSPVGPGFGKYKP